MSPTGPETEPGPGGVLSAEFRSRPATVAHAVARLLAARGLDRVYGLPGGHVKPIWDELDRAGVRIVSTRHECAAVHMAQAEADLTHELAVAIVTTGPGLTNAVTGIACANLARSPVLVVSAIPPGPQLGMGALEQIDQVAIVTPVTRFARSVSVARHALPTLDRAIAAALGEDGPQGPAYVDFTTELLRAPIPPPYEGDAAFRPRRRSPMPPDPAAIGEGAELIGASRRPLVVAGAAVKPDPTALREFLELTGALCVDTRESKGAVGHDAEGYVPAVRARAIAEADLIITLGRSLDFELAYGSAAIFRPRVRFLRIGRTFEELAGNRRGDCELRADVPSALHALSGAQTSPVDLDRAWRDRLIAENRAKSQRLEAEMSEQPPGEDGRMHPYAALGAAQQVHRR